ncbi:proteasome subunit alpha type-7-1 [Halyomorpha halys]|uniref:proteasome subunit alpha type-7-1 n=1 Tax=Halyomorpha halys TaxID=286706 RepID=UPI0006D4F01C|nr:proteasome subunit alpha type-7-1 [Halyomorpha halys]
MSERYDRAITVFSPDGRVLQVEYAQEAVRKGSTAVGIRGEDTIVLGVEKRTVQELQEERTVRKICSLDEHVALAFAGLTADARIIVNRARIECQAHRLTLEDAVSISYITKFVAELKQKYTQSSGRRPFGISCIIGGFDPDGSPHLFQTEPSGVFYEWKANVTGRGDKIVKEFLEKNKVMKLDSEDSVLKLAMKALLEVVQPDKKNFELAVLKRGEGITKVEEEVIDGYITQICKENEEEKKKHKLV